MNKLLDNINSPDDLKKLNIDELAALCGEIREFLIDSVSKTGGHLASNLGVVELTVALHTVFNVPQDKIIFDVGHQSYVHKILTGRKDSFSTLRQFGGLSGFPKRSESDCDAFDTGHSSTSVSAALGLARARDLAGDDFNIITVFGDGALTGGMMYEAMNDAGHVKTPLILVLNDNAMSISKNVGAVAKHLRKLRMSPVYFRSKHVVESVLKKIPLLGKVSVNIIKKIKRFFRRLVIPTTMFDDMGFTYMGPVDGHDIKAMIQCFEYVKDEKKPVFIHIQTKKGKGYAHAESNPRKFHGISPFDIATGETKEGSETYSSRFGSVLVNLAQDNDKIVAITGAMPDGTGLEEFEKHFKNRFFDVGIAEQHGVTLSAGLAAGGYIPVIPLYSSFLQRAYDQVLHDVCLQNLHVVFPIDRAGIVGQDGETHQGIYDISYLSHMPNMTILSPATLGQLEEMLKFAINDFNAPIAIRYPRGGTEADNIPQDFTLGKAQLVQEGNDVTIVASGRMVKRAEEVSALAGKSVEILALPTIKPLDTEAIIASALKTKHLITIEDNVKTGGMGSMVAALLEETHTECEFKIFAFPDTPITHGTVEELDKLYGLDAIAIASKIQEL
ncbi:MAG: 1-deoxy-D-xylulose-5-phosphate synthase [Oscillospiraceae bacterium]|nr:1-deoxy-D-xylulose-5-phosphate synthase [Oscillospiraceae bacterium]